MIDNPFFILGSVRSGTTLLRDLLRQHPKLICPEETHFFRWADPFGTRPYKANYARKALFQEHRELDGVDDFDFFYTLRESDNRRTLQDHYMRLYQEANNAEGKRWFDKTPQNVYGLMLLSGLYPKAVFVHVHRHPYNVVASLRTGKVIRQQELSAAINFWLESAIILREYKQAFPERLLEIAYNELTSKPLETVNHILDFVGEPALDAIQGDVHEERDRFRELLTDQELAQIDQQCGALMKHYGYGEKD